MKGFKEIVCQEPAGKGSFYFKNVALKLEMIHGGLVKPEEILINLLIYLYFVDKSWEILLCCFLLSLMEWLDLSLICCSFPGH